MDIEQGEYRRMKWSDSTELLGIGLLSNLVLTSIYMGIEHTGYKSHVAFIKLLRQVDKVVEGKILFDPLHPMVLKVMMEAMPEENRITINSIRKYLNRIIRGVRSIGVKPEIFNKEETEKYLGKVIQGCLDVASKELKYANHNKEYIC